jgi:hypothetical protein
VDVVVNDVVRRRGDIFRRAHPHRHRPVIRDRKEKGIDRRRRRRQVDKIDRPRRQEEHRRRWRWFKPEIRIVEHQHRAVDIDDFVRRRRWHVVSNHGKLRRRLECRRKISEPAPRIVGMRAARVAPQIRPVGRWRVDAARAAPSDGLAARRDDGANAPRHRVVRVGIQEGLVVGQRVAVDRGQIGLLGAEFPHRPGPDRGGLFG